MSSDVQAADWALLVENKKADVTIFYDSYSISASNNTIRIWLKWVYKNHEFKEHENQLFELNCRKQISRIGGDYIFEGRLVF